MTPDERDRLTRLEAAKDATDAELAEVKARLSSMDAKLDELLMAKNMGQGALWLLLKIGALATGAIAVATWIGQHVRL